MSTIASTPPFKFSSRAAWVNLRNAAGTEIGTVGNPLVISGTVTVGSVDTELPAAAALADTTANPTTPLVGAALEVFNGTTWDRARGDITNGLDVDVTRINGNVSVLGTKTHNSGVPGSTNVGTLPAIANANPPSFTETNQVGLSTDLAGNLRVIESGAPRNVSATGALNALDAAISISSQGMSDLFFEIDTGSLVGTVVFEASLDSGSTWFAVPALLTDNSIVADTATFAARGWFTLSTATNLRLRVSAYTSGSSAARIIGSQGVDTVKLAAPLPAGFNTIGIVYALTFDTIDVAPSYPFFVASAGSAVLPAAISADGNLKGFWLNEYGALHQASRPILSAYGTASTLGNNTLIAAVASNKIKVVAFSISTFSIIGITAIFQSGAGGANLWGLDIQAVTGESKTESLSIAPPSWLFQTAVNTLLNLNLSAAQTVHWSVSYYLEP